MWCRYDGNQYLCMNGVCRQSSNSTSSNDSKVKIVVGMTLGGVVLVALAFFVGIIMYKRKSRRETTTSSKDSIRSKESRHLYEKGRQICSIGCFDVPYNIILIQISKLLFNRSSLRQTSRWFWCQIHQSRVLLQSMRFL